MTKQAIQIKGEASEAEIKKWKSAVGEVHKIKVKHTENENELHVCYVKKPDLDIIGASAKHAESDPVLSLLIMFNSVWLGGSEEIKNNDEMKLGAMKLVKNIFKTVEGEIEKL